MGAERAPAHEVNLYAKFFWLARCLAEPLTRGASPSSFGRIVDTVPSAATARRPSSVPRIYAAKSRGVLSRILRSNPVSKTAMAASAARLAAAAETPRA